MVLENSHRVGLGRAGGAGQRIGQVPRHMAADGRRIEQGQGAARLTGTFHFGTNHYKRGQQSGGHYAWLSWRARKQAMGSGHSSNAITAPPMGLHGANRVSLL
jgi:hypothetical protein